VLDTWKREGRTAIIATHDLSAAAESADRMVVLSEDHTIVADGPPEEVLAQRELLLSVNLIHEHAHQHELVAHTHAHAHRHPGGASASLGGSGLLPCYMPPRPPVLPHCGLELRPERRLASPSLPARQDFASPFRAERLDRLLVLPGTVAGPEPKANRARPRASDANRPRS
jgi:ABC-type glutathione transport system ATPase component